MKDSEIRAKAQGQLNRLGWGDVGVEICGTASRIGTLVFTIGDSPVAILEPVYRDGQIYFYAYTVTWKRLPEAESDLDHALFAIFTHIMAYKLGEGA